MANIKGQYLNKDLGDGTTVSLINAKRVDDGTFALAFRLRAGEKSVTCFLETVDAVSYVDELVEALQDYQADRQAVEEEENTRRAEEHDAMKTKRDSNKKKVTS
jgi:hypothetical protein